MALVQELCHSRSPAVHEFSFVPCGHLETRYNVNCRKSLLMVSLVPSPQTSSARPISSDLLFGRTRTLEKLWREFFSDPSQWWDHRLEKVNPRYPDFKHKKTQQSLWSQGNLTPSWVEAELAAMAPGIVQCNIFSWNIKLQRYVKSGDYEKTIELFQQMQEEGINPNKFTFVPVLNACSSLRSLDEGRYIHDLVMEKGYEGDVFVSSCLVDMYAKCGSIKDARRVFNKMPTRDVVAWTSMIVGYVKCREGQNALELFRQMQQEGVKPDIVTFAAVLNACASIAALEEGRHVHEKIIESGHESDVFVGSCLVDMYAKCGSIGEAQSLFNRMRTRNVIAWSAMILGYVKCGEGRKALELSGQMQQEGVNPDPVTFVAMLKACASLASLEEGRFVHGQIIKRGYEYDIFVGSCLVDMYAKCGCIEDARRVFNRMPVRNVVVWNAMMLGYVKCGEGQKALKLHREMHQDGLKPDIATFVALLNACASVGALEEGRFIHREIIERGYDGDVSLSSCLVDMYAKCGSIEEAQKMFHKMPTRGVVAWTAMILGYVNCGEGQKALELYREMRQVGVDPDLITFLAVLNACAKVVALQHGRRVHEEIIERGYSCDAVVSSCLVDMYAKCGDIECASRVFNKMATRDVVAWTAMIVGYVKFKQGEKALEIYSQMQQEGVKPDSVTFVAVLNACASMMAIEQGRCVHKQIIEQGFDCDVIVGSHLVDMYARFGLIEDAQRVFNKMPMRNGVVWNAMIMGYVKCGEGQKALDLFRQMQQQGVNPDPVTFVAVLNGCASIAAFEEGRCVHKQIIKRGYECDVFVGNSLVDMYAKCGSIGDAWKVFSRMLKRDVVTWNAMILGYVKCGEGQKALRLYWQMGQEGVDPDPVTFVAVLNACASVAALEEGTRVHEQIIEKGYKCDGFIGSCLVDMYAKCASIVDAQAVFNKLPTKDVVSWNAMLAGYSRHGHAKAALEHFECMCKIVEVNDVTFTCLLSACSHGGLLNDGLYYFESMCPVFNISPKAEHYACVVDILGRAGRLEEAKYLVRSMPFESATVWLSLLGACRIHGNVEMGEFVAKRVLELDPSNAASYVLLSNIYAAAGKWDNSARVQQERLDRGVKKMSERAWIEVNNEVHSFIVDDSEHCQIVEIHAELQGLSREIVAAGYVPDTRFVLDCSDDVSDESSFV